MRCVDLYTHFMSRPDCSSNVKWLRNAFILLERAAVRTQSVVYTGNW